MKLQERLDALTERENPWPLVRFGAKWLLVIFALGIGLRIVCAPLFYAGKAAQVAAEQIDPRALLAKYEWFKDAHASLDRFHANIKVYRQRERGVLKAYGADRYRWPAPTTKDSACTTEPEAASGVNKANVTVATGPTGLTVEQMNVSRRVIEDNKPGAVKHLYVISAMSGQVLLYSTVHGKVTSSGKRLSPLTTTTGTSWCMTVAVRGHEICTSEMLQDDGTYGSSVDYVYWWDTKGVYHQLYVTGGEIVVITSQPVNVPHVVINLNSARDVAASG